MVRVSLPIGMAVVAAALWTAPASAQVERIGTTIGGATFGAAAGLYTTTAIFVGKARAGSYLYAMGEVARLRWETVPMVAGPIVGGVMGATSPERLGHSVLLGGAGFLAGGGLGWIAGTLFGDAEEHKWAGAILGSAAGLLAGSIVGALRAGDDEEPAALTIAVPLRIGGSR